MNINVIDSKVAIYRERLMGMTDGWIIDPTEKNNYQWILVNTTHISEGNNEGIKQQLDAIDLEWDK